MHALHAALLRDAVAACRCHYGSRLLALAVYGSVGRGKPRPDSDIDLLLVATDLPDGPSARNEEFAAVRTALAPRLAAAARAGLHPELSPVFKTRAELARGTPLLLDMTEDARILHDPDGCLADALQRVRRRLGELGSRRVWRGDYWYWTSSRTTGRARSSSCSDHDERRPRRQLSGQGHHAPRHPPGPLPTGRVLRRGPGSTGDLRGRFSSLPAARDRALRSASQSGPCCRRSCRR